MNSKNSIIISGSYDSTINKKEFYSNNIFNLFDNEYTKNQYITELNKKKQNVLELELINTNLLHNIYSFENKCRLKNIKNSNTTNFIIANSINIKFLIERMINIYNENIIKINNLNEKIQNITSYINYLSNI